METLKKIINNNGNPLSDETLGKLWELVQPFSYKKNERFTIEGTVCNYLYFIEEGGVKAYYTHEGNAHINWIYYDNEICTAWYSFINKQPGIETFEASENTKGYKLSFNAFRQLKMEAYDFALYFLSYYEGILAFYDLWSKKFLSYTAKEKYQFIMEYYPSIFLRATNQDIASILGISRETLSRMKKDSKS